MNAQVALGGGSVDRRSSQPQAWVAAGTCAVASPRGRGLSFRVAEFILNGLMQAER